MRTDYLRRLFLSLFTASLLAPTSARAEDGSINLQWQPSPDAPSPGMVTSYLVYYSRHPLTNVVAGALDAFTSVLSVGNRTNTTVTGLLGGNTYYFAVCAQNSVGTQSDLSAAVMASVVGGLVPDLPPLADGLSGVPSAPSSPQSGTSPSQGQSVNNTPTQLNLVGLLPRLWAGQSNGAPVLTVGGAIGATFTIQYSTNVTGFEEWTTITNIKMSSIAPNTTEPTGNALNRAFVPSLEQWTDLEPMTTSSGMKFYRIHMPYGYAVVADQVLRPKGFNTRLIATRLAALNAYIVCYVTEEFAYLDYNDETFIVKLQQSGPTIREVASKVAAVLGENWTSASEFTVTDGLKQILATVVQTDPPSADPSLGSPGGISIAIDF